MKPEAQRIAIAEACGVIRLATVAETLPAMIEWLEEEPHPHAQLTKPPWCEILRGNKIPDYLNDLNAIQEAVLGLKTKNSQQLFEWCLSDILNDDSWLVINATAAQRAEAFLKTIGKWEDE